MSSTQSSDLFFPPEWYPQSGVQLTWPHADTDWAYCLEEAQECFRNIACEIAKRELVLIVTPDPEDVRKQISSHVNMENVRLFKCKTNDTWARDHGAITILANEEPLIIDFQFNGWGLKFPANEDNQITRRLVDKGILNGEYRNFMFYVLEGGSIESDGMGTLLTTTACLTSPNRNVINTKSEIEQNLRTILSTQRVLWLDHGYLAGDDTDGHVDTLARFCSPDSIAYIKCDDKDDEHHDALLKMEFQLKTFRTPSGEPYRLFALPMVDKIEEDGERLPAGYANFLIINGAVLFPTYNQPHNDSKAKEVLQQAFPDREIIGIDCRVLIKQHGSLHCVTMQYPPGVIK